MKDQTTVETIVAGFDKRIEEVNIEIANISLPKPIFATLYAFQYDV